MEPALSPDNEEKGGPFIFSLTAPVSPPTRRVSTSRSQPKGGSPSCQPKTGDKGEAADSPPNLASIEAGKVQITDHLTTFSSRLRECSRPQPTQGVSPRLPIADWVELYQRNHHPQGRHFVVHQHDHPIAGPHYDLRLQFSGTSSVSWSIMYGLPGDPNSQRLNRNATETRVHCLWNHLIETASPTTGSMLIWDTGVYEVLPYEAQTFPETDDSQSESSDASQTLADQRSESEKLREGFRNRKIRLRLHGTRLPPNYTIMLRLDKASDFARPIHVPRKRRRRRQSARIVKSRRPTNPPPLPPSGNSSPKTPPKDEPASPDEDSSEDNAMADSDEEMDQQIRESNAYPGSTNSIGSIHQRRWFITLDRANSGFKPEQSTGSGKKRWVRRAGPIDREPVGFEPFYVRGPDVESSVVTGRLERDIFEDEGVQGFVRRRGWRPVLN